MVRQRLASFRFRAEGGCGDFAGDTIGECVTPNRSESPAGGWPPLARGSREPPAKRALSIGRLDRWGSSGCTAGDGLSAGNSVLPAAAKRVRGPKVP